MPRTTKKRKTRKRNVLIGIETDLTPEQLEKLSKLFATGKVGQIEIPLSPDSVMKMQRS